MPCETPEEMKARLERHRGHEYQPLILMQIEAHQKGCVNCQRENKKRGTRLSEASHFEEPGQKPLVQIRIKPGKPLHKETQNCCPPKLLKNDCWSKGEVVET
jgi:hypothetical protein